MEEGSHERFTVLCPSTLSNSSSKRHEILRYNQWVKFLVPLKQCCHISMSNVELNHLFHLIRLIYYIYTFQRHGLKASGSLYVFGFTWRAEFTSMMVQPAGIVYPSKHFANYNSSRHWTKYMHVRTHLFTKKVTTYL